MKEERSAIRYAKAILSFAQESGDQTRVNEDMQLIGATIAENLDLKLILKSPVIKSLDKKEALQRLFSGKISTIALGVFDLLHENKRMSLLHAIAKQYSVVYDLSKSIQLAKVTTAIPLTEKLEKKIMEKIVALTGNKTLLKNSVDPAILGGFILQVGDIQYNASISYYLSKLKKEFDNSHFIPRI